MTAGSGDCNLPPAALTGYRYRQTGLLATGYWELETGNWQLATGNRQPATGYWLAAFTVTVAPVRSGAQ
jgi:hypothetical protein